MNRNVHMEINILWLEDAKNYPYLREFGLNCSAKQGWRKKWGDGLHVVAIAELSPEARTVQRQVYRRAWLVEDGVDPYPQGRAPSEAVLPDSIAAGGESRYGRHLPVAP